MTPPSLATDPKENVMDVYISFRSHVWISNLISMASMCCQPIADSSPHASIVKFSKHLPPNNTSMFGCTAYFNDRRLQASPAVGESLPSARTADLSEDGETLNSDDDDDDLPSVKQILASSRAKRAKRVVDLTSDDEAPVAEQRESFLEIPETPAVALETMRPEEDDHGNNGEEHRDGSTQTVAAASVVAGDAVSEVDISNFTTTKILDKRSSLGGVEYKCELWLPADLVERVQMGRVHVRNYEKGLVQAARLDTLRKRTQKRRHSQM